MKVNNDSSPFSLMSAARERAKRDVSSAELLRARTHLRSCDVRTGGVVDGGVPRRGRVAELDGVHGRHAAAVARDDKLPV